MERLILKDGEISYQMKGSGPSLLLLHAGIADSRMWDVQYHELAEHFRVIRCDLRGYGRSHLPNGPFAYHDDVGALIDALHVGPAWLIGASFGARVAIDVALTYPRHVKGLVLVAPAVGGFRPEREVLEFSEREDVLLDAGKLDEATELNLRMWVDGPSRSREAVDATLRSRVGEMQRLAFSHPEPEHVSLRGLDPPAIERLHDIHHPVLIISGALDVPEFLHLSEVLVDQIPGAEKIVIPEVAHMVSLEAPETFMHCVSEFILAQENRKTTRAPWEQ